MEPRPDPITTTERRQREFFLLLRFLLQAMIPLLRRIVAWIEQEYGLGKDEGER